MAQWTGKIDAYDDAFLVVAALRYTIGRRSYAPGLLMDWLKRRVDDLNVVTRKQLAGEIREEIERHPDTHDSTGWLRTADLLSPPAVGDT